MDIKSYFNELEKCVEYCKKNKRFDLYDSYYGELRGAREVIRLINEGYSVNEQCMSYLW